MEPVFNSELGGADVRLFCGDGEPALPFGVLVGDRLCEFSCEFGRRIPRRLGDFVGEEQRMLVKSIFLKLKLLLPAIGSSFGGSISMAFLVETFTRQIRYTRGVFHVTKPTIRSGGNDCRGKKKFKKILQLDLMPYNIPA